MKLEKNGVIKNIENEREAGDYMAAGWKKVEDKQDVSNKGRQVSEAR